MARVGPYVAVCESMSDPIRNVPGKSAAYHTYYRKPLRELHHEHMTWYDRSAVIVGSSCAVVKQTSFSCSETPDQNSRGNSGCTELAHEKHTYEGQAHLS